ncbi:right-handed parallel beta-helix repeat-containing protein [Burkholderia pseudomallei]|uniref:right-handed parallel beta-helix repeat-containing protein n=1 Tax=Burkholderia pseudomallei TaxID=28450 RepID=UPI0013232683|nr:right-handed parallel beta-helix repeat-containing protein [Burkholderia pseudomallei]MVZ87058.1 right-handed parallel beta-helix repeat-containing protein [Burkholderia pseudomallei]
MMNRSQQTFAGFAAACAFAAGSAAQAWAAPADAIVYPAGNGSDQADALQAALDALQTGQRLVLAPGQYVVGRSLLVKNAQVVVSGYGATLVATNDADQTIEMRGRDSTLVGVTLVGTGATRLTTPESTKVDVTGAGVQVLDVEVRGGASAGIFVFGGTDVAVVGNTVRDTLADGIHTTYGSRNVLVRDNTVQNTGDDMVAVVSYKGDGKLSSNVLIQNNTLLGNYWGRGATVVGGADVTITGNTVRNVQKAAGILVGQEDPANTYDARNVIVSNNTISDIEWPDPDNTRPPAYMAAIDVNTWSGKATSVSVTDNRISRARYAGVRALGNVCQLRVSRNALASIDGTPIALQQAPSCAAGQIVCASNTLDGAALASPAGCSATDGLTITGANVARMPQVRAYLRQTAAPSAAQAGSAAASGE